MMREFQAENDRRQTSVENDSTMLLNADSNEMILPSTPNDQSAPSTPTRQRHLDQQLKTTNPMKMNTPERRVAADRNKFPIRTSKLPSDTLKVNYFAIIIIKTIIFIDDNIIFLNFRHRDVRTMLHMIQTPIITHELNRMM